MEVADLCALLERACHKAGKDLPKGIGMAIIMAELDVDQGMVVGGSNLGSEEALLALAESYVESAKDEACRIITYGWDSDEQKE